jgi:predicted HD phosphohydrolase
VSAETVSFTAMADGTVADYELLARREAEYVAALPDRLLVALEALADSFPGYQVSRLEHSLQSATRAYDDGRDEEYVVAALLHDIGDSLAPHTHGEMTAAILAPYVSEKLCWIVRHHGAFQQFYSGRHTGDDPNARDRWRDHPWFDDCVEFCERYDQNCFDPAFESRPLELFAPMVRRVFAAPRHLDRWAR